MAVSLKSRGEKSLRVEKPKPGLDQHIWAKPAAEHASCAYCLIRAGRGRRFGGTIGKQSPLEFQQGIRHWHERQHNHSEGIALPAHGLWAGLGVLEIDLQWAMLRISILIINSE